MTEKNWTYQSLSRRTQWLVIGLMVHMVLLSVLTFLDVLAMLTIPGWNDPNVLMQDTPWELAIGFLLGISALGILLFFIFNTVLVCMWMYRANVNARALGAEGMTVTPGWSAGWWFIPFANLLMPFRAMKEIYLTSQRTAWTGNVKTSKNPRVLVHWWTLWLIGNFISSFTVQAAWSNDPTLADIVVWVSLIELTFSIVAAILLIQIVRQVLQWQLDWCSTHDNTELRRCANCGYDLRITTGAFCPECGAIITDRKASTSII